MGKKVFRSILKVSPFADGKYWYLLENFNWESEAQSAEKVTVPEGFVTDFASIPKPLWGLLPQWARYGPAAIVHDYLYWEQSVTRLRADQIMLEAMQNLKVSRVAIFLIYRALRLFGGFTYKSNRRKKDNGHIKHVTDPPDDPLETWESYRHKFKLDPR